MSVLQIMKEKLVGEVLTNLEYGYSADIDYAKNHGERYIPLPAKITGVHIHTNKYREDTILRFELEGHDDDDENFYAYINESFSLKSDN